MPKSKLTREIISKAVAGPTEYVHWDTEVGGLGLRVSTTARKTFIFQYRIGRKSGKYKIGPSDLSLSEVRKIALEKAAKVARGIDPAAEREDARNAVLFREFSDRFDVVHIETGQVKQRTADEYRRALKKDILPALGNKPLGDVTNKDIFNLHSAMRERPIQANRTFEIVRLMFNKAEEWGFRALNTNPCRGIRKYPETKNERFLSLAELKRLFEVLKELEDERREMPSAIAAIRLLALTGCRLNEILRLEWHHVDFDAGVLRLPDSKTGRKNVQLCSRALSVLQNIDRSAENPWVIAGKLADQPLADLQPFWQRVRARAGIHGVRIHDLRHTFASVAASEGMALLAIGKLLGHKSLQSTARYAHLADGTMRQAADLVGGRIASVM